MVKNSKKNIIFIFLIILSTLALLLIYISPQKIEADSVAISKVNDSDTANVSIYLTKRRYIFKPTQITGKIIFNGVEYENISSFGYDTYSSNSFLENLKLKFQGFCYDLFVRSDFKGQQTNLLTDTITIESLSNNEIIICKSSDPKDTTVLYTITINS